MRCGETLRGYEAAQAVKSNNPHVKCAKVGDAGVSQKCIQNSDKPQTIDPALEAPASITSKHSTKCLEAGERDPDCPRCADLRTFRENCSSGVKNDSALPVSIQNVTPTCRRNRGDRGAIEEAMTRIERAYLSYVGALDNAEVTWRISLARVAASADTHPQGGDSTEIEAPAPLSGAVPPEEAGDAQPPPGD